MLTRPDFSGGPERAPAYQVVEWFSIFTSLYNKLFLITK